MPDARWPKENGRSLRGAAAAGLGEAEPSGSRGTERATENARGPEPSGGGTVWNLHTGRVGAGTGLPCTAKLPLPPRSAPRPLQGLQIPNTAGLWVGMSQPVRRGPCLPQGLHDSVPGHAGSQAWIRQVPIFTVLPAQGPGRMVSWPRGQAGPGKRLRCWWLVPNKGRLAFAQRLPPLSCPVHPLFY